MIDDIIQELRLRKRKMIKSEKNILTFYLSYNA